MADSISWLEKQKNLWKRELEALQRVSNDVMESAAQALKRSESVTSQHPGHTHTSTGEDEHRSALEESMQV